MCMRRADHTQVSSPAKAGDPVIAGDASKHVRRLLDAPLSRGMTAAFVCAVSIFLNAGAAFAADDVAVDVQNASEPTLCAEKDNVYLKLASPEVRQFKIESVHPNYIGTIVVDRSAFDLHNCPDLAATPYITEKPRRITIYEDQDFIQAALRVGAAGYVFKRRISSDLSFAVSEALAGRTFISPTS